MQREGLEQAGAVDTGEQVFRLPHHPVEEVAVAQCAGRPCQEWQSGGSGGVVGRAGLRAEAPDRGSFPYAARLAPVVVGYIRPRSSRSAGLRPYQAAMACL